MTPFTDFTRVPRARALKQVSAGVPSLPESGDSATVARKIKDDGELREKANIRLAHSIASFASYMREGDLSSRFFVTGPVNGGNQFWEIHDSKDETVINNTVASISNRYEFAQELIWLLLGMMRAKERLSGL